MAQQQPGYSQGVVSTSGYTFQMPMATTSAAGSALAASRGSVSFTQLPLASSSAVPKPTTLAPSVQHANMPPGYSSLWNEQAVVPSNDVPDSGAGSSPTLGSHQTNNISSDGKNINGKRTGGGAKSGGVRKSRAGNAAVKSASPDDDDNDNDDSSEEMDEKRRKFLERNRVAASKCRQKKKMWIKELERRAEDATMQNRTLHLAVAQLKEEVIILKTQLLAHRNCGCSAIQQYLQADCGDPMAHAAVAAATVPLTQPLPGTVMQDPTAAAAAAVVAAAAGFPLTATQPPPLTQQMPPPPPAPPHAPVHGFVTASSAFIEQTHPSASPNPGSQAATSLVATPALNSTAFGRGLNDVQVP